LGKPLSANKGKPHEDAFGNWTLQSNFDGNDTYNASQSTACTVDVND
jgi:hypothetical protein